MNNMKEISRQSVYSETEGIACGPVGITAVDAEIVVDDNGEKVFLHAQWVCEAGDEILFEATRESIYEVYEKLNTADGDEFEALIEERDRIEAGKIADDSKYQAFYDELVKMIDEEKAANGFVDYGEEDDEDEEDEEE